jgi:hypothetical protein
LAPVGYALEVAQRGPPKTAIDGISGGRPSIKPLTVPLDPSHHDLTATQTEQRLCRHRTMV